MPELVRGDIEEVERTGADDQVGRPLRVPQIWSHSLMYRPETGPVDLPQMYVTATMPPPPALPNSTLFSPSLTVLALPEFDES